MTQEEKQLLLKDLCARLPYGVKVQCDKYPFPVTILYAGDLNEVKFKETGGIEHIDCVMPYLRPMSSMTEEETKIHGDLICNCQNYEVVDWLNAHHFDYRGLIEKGLALEAPEGMYEIG